MQTVSLAGRPVGSGAPAFIVAEMSANHDRDLRQALRLVDVAAEAGVDALKLQTYTADSLSLRTDFPGARLDPVWGSATLYELYERAAMPWEFHAPIFEAARERGLIAFSTAFDENGVDELEKLDVPAYKVASFELVHFPLLRRVARTGKPVILSTGTAGLGEVEEALDVLKAAGAKDIVILHCCSAYPADPSTVNLAAMQTLRTAFGFPVGFSDHTLGCAVPVAAVVLGACLIEKHFTNDTTRKGPDHRFSIGPEGLKSMVASIRAAEASIGSGLKAPDPCEQENREVGRRSIFACRDIPPGAEIRADMLRIVRPGAGLHPRHTEDLVGRRAGRAIRAGWPIRWEDLDKGLSPDALHPGGSDRGRPGETKP